MRTNPELGFDLGFQTIFNVTRPPIELKILHLPCYIKKSQLHVVTLNIDLSSSNFRAIGLSYYPPQRY